MTRSLLIRGMIIGLIAGLLVFAVAKIWGEPQVDHAIAFETAMDAAKAKAAIAAGHPAQPPDPELVSRPMQASWGLLTGTMVYSTAFGGLFALVFSFVNGRVGRADPRMVSFLLAVLGLIAVFIVPDIKYPSNPPSVGMPETIGRRTMAYFLMMACSIGGMIGAVTIRQRLARAQGVWAASMIGGAFYVVFEAIVMSILPVIQEVPPGFDAVVLWKFRIATVAMQLVMWLTLGLGFGTLAHRVFEGRQRLSGKLAHRARS